MAKHLGISPPTINQWVNGVRPLPAERCPEIEKATNGAVTCEELRPDVDWAYLRGTRADNACPLGKIKSHTTTLPDSSSIR